MDKKGISGSTLKIIAMAAMLIDHTAAVLLARLLLQGQLTENYSGVFHIYQLMRQIGRIAFPIFCFLLTEGFYYTKSRKKYAFRLGVFALISEVPFDLAFNGKMWDMGYQNVYFTLFIGVLTMFAFQTVKEKENWSASVKTIGYLVCMLGGMAAAMLLRCDYSYVGILCIMVMYLFRKNKNMQIAAGALSFAWFEPAALAAFVPIYFYNGKRGLPLKYVFYGFYPLHLLFLFGIAYWMGYGGVKVA